MRIAVLADTHDRYPPGLPGRLRDADEIWHLGDVCAAATLVAFAQLGPPLQVVLGNCDSHDGWPVELTLERGGVRFYLTHIPPRAAPAGVEVVLHGHTHVPRDETIGGVRWLNPGSVSLPNPGTPPSFAWLTLTADGNFGWKIMPV
jgi:putative phosphoesterase